MVRERDLNPFRAENGYAEINVVRAARRTGSFGRGGRTVRFKSHPYYDDSDAADWLSLRPDDWADPESGPEIMLHDTLKAHRQRLCELALDRIRAAASGDYLNERPYPEVNEFLYFPINDHGYQVYVEYFFLQRPDENSPDSDFWWAIINCPYALAPFPTGRREEYVIGLGWVVQ